jgi:cytoplasmic iron level regulating protein YaaA (DUF328/UPF0246 family)
MKEEVAMNIIISPSKTQNRIDGSKVTHVPQFQIQAEELQKILMSWSREKIAEKYNLKGKLLDQTCKEIEGFKIAEKEQAFKVYTGQVFRQIVSSEGHEEYMDEHLVILSAMYGVLKPSDGILNYRLDMKVKVFEDQTLYDFWKKTINQYFKEDKIILNLASDEFSKMVNVPMTDVKFLECKEGSCKVIGTYSKIARGKILDYLIKNELKSINDVCCFKEEGYRYDDEKSTKNILIFTREI